MTRLRIVLLIALLCNLQLLNVVFLLLKEPLVVAYPLLENGSLLLPLLLECCQYLHLLFDLLVEPSNVGVGLRRSLI